MTTVPKTTVFRLQDRFKRRMSRSFNRKSKGQALRNRAYTEAQGDFIQYLDADDLLGPDKIETQVLLLQASPPGILAVSATVHFFDGGKPESGKAEDGWPCVDSDDPLNWLIEVLGPERGSMVAVGAWLTPRSVAEESGPWNATLSINDDGEYFGARSWQASEFGGHKRGDIIIGNTGLETVFSGRKSVTHMWAAIRAIELIEQHLLARTDDPRAKSALLDCIWSARFPAFSDGTQSHRRGSAKS